MTSRFPWLARPVARLLGLVGSIGLRGVVGLVGLAGLVAVSAVVACSSAGSRPSAPEAPPSDVHGLSNGLAGPGAAPSSPPAAGPGGRGSLGTAPAAPSSPAGARRPTTPDPPGRRPPAHRVWEHRPGLTWQWQLTGPLDLTVHADVYELDAFTTPASAVDRLHAAGRRVICYVNVGAYEDFRPDAGRFGADLLGASNGWPGERWLDIRRWTRLLPVLRERLEMCRDKGFDAAEADNVDGYANRSGFPLTAADQLLFNRRVAGLAHAYGLAVGLKNDLDQVAVLEPVFDFAVNEECFRYDECERLRPFTAAGKPVFNAEYDVAPDRFCAAARSLNITAIRKRMDLDAWRTTC